MIYTDFEWKCCQSLEQTSNKFGSIQVRTLHSGDK